MSFKENIPAWLSAIATLLATFATIGLWYIASSLNQTQETVLKLQEAELSARRVANVEIVGGGGGWSIPSDQAGADWIYAEVAFKNTSKGNPAKNIKIIYQAYGGKSWSGFFEEWWDKKNQTIIEQKDPNTGIFNNFIKIPLKGPPERTIDLKPEDEPFTTVMFSQTTDNPVEKCLTLGERSLIALRIDWDNPNGGLGCKVAFIELSCPASAAAPPNNRRPLVRLVPRPPENEVEPPPAIWPCPE